MSVLLEEAVLAEQELSKTLDAYVGEWVAVHDHKLVAHAPTLHELLDALNGQDVDGVFQVVEERGAASFF